MKMKQPKFNRRQLDAIGECVLESILNLRRMQDSTQLSGARARLEHEIDNLNEILTILADASHEK